MSESTTEQSSREQEREAFEDWIRKDGGDLSTFGSGKHVHYNNTAVESAWEAWRVRASLAEQRTRAMREALRSILDQFEEDSGWGRADIASDELEAARALISTPPSAPGKGEAEGKDAWISVHDRVPAVGQEVLVFGQSPWEKAPSIKVDLWDEIHEAPVSFSSATVSVGEGWTENDSDDITHWRELPPAPAQSGGQGNG